jgi:hypothetical protein
VPFSFQKNLQKVGKSPMGFPKEDPAKQIQNDIIRLLF